MVVMGDLLKCNAYLCLNKLYLQSRLIPAYACINIQNKSAATNCTNTLHDHSHVVILIAMEAFFFCWCCATNCYFSVAVSVFMSLDEWVKTG